MANLQAQVFEGGSSSSSDSGGGSSSSDSGSSNSGDGASTSSAESYGNAKNTATENSSGENVQENSTEDTTDPANSEEQGEISEEITSESAENSSNETPSEQEALEPTEEESLIESDFPISEDHTPAAEEKVAEEAMSEEVLPEPVLEEVNDLEETKHLLEGRLLTGSLPLTTFPQQAKIKLADVKLENKQVGDALAPEEALVAIISLMTTEEDLQKTVLKTVLDEAPQQLAQALLADEKTSEKVVEVMKNGPAEDYQQELQEAISNPAFQQAVSLDLETDPEVKEAVEPLMTQETQEKIVEHLVEASMKDVQRLDVKDVTRQTLESNSNQLVLKEILTEKLVHKESVQNILLNHLNQADDTSSGITEEKLIKVNVTGPSGLIELPFESLRFEAGSVVLLIDPVRTFVPGFHKAEIEIFNPITQERAMIQQEFIWGVLAVNTHKDVYEPGEEGVIAMGVLDEKGKPVCDASLILDIVYPNGSKARSPVENTGNCEILDSKNTAPDYRSVFVFEGLGEYQLNVQAVLPNGKVYFSTSKVNVIEAPHYVIEREAATRLYPVGDSPMTIKVKFAKAFNGIITDVVPASFEISQIKSGGVLEERGAEKWITWPVEAKAGEIKVFEYLYDAPDISPEFYVMGPLQSDSDLLEARQWQIANDEPVIEADSTSSLRLHWKFNEGSGTTATDSGANSLSGTLTNMEAGDWSTSTPTASNQNPFALDFDGTNEYVTRADSSLLDFGAINDFTITGWFYRDTATTDDTIVAKKNDQTTGAGYIVWVDDSFDTLILHVADGVDQYSIVGSTTFTTPGWNHFAAVWDQDNATNSEIYINGVDDNATDVGTIANIDNLANALEFRVGAESDGGNPFDGKIDDVRVYSRVLTSDEIAVLAAGNRPGGVANLSLWLRADQGTTVSGSDVTAWADQSGNGSNFTQVTTANQPDFTSSAVNFNPAITFDGVNDRMTSLFTSNPLSVFSVIRNTDTESNERVFFGSNNSSLPYSSAQKTNNTGGNAAACHYLGSTEECVTTTSLDNQFYLHEGHLTGPSSGTVSLVVNGSQIGTNPGSGTLASRTVSAVGAGYNTTTLTNFFQGDIAEILVYSVNKTSTDRQKIESYLALKYGITLDQSAVGGGMDYLLSDGTVMWNDDSSNVFEHDIAGIAQDDTSALNQTKSKSVNTDAILTVGEATLQSDMDFMTWSNNNGAATWTTTGAPSGYKILSRVWQTQESTGDIGTVDLEFDVADGDFDVPALQGGNGYYFIYDSDDDGSLSDETPVLMKDDGTSGDDVATDNRWTRQQAFPANAGGGGAIREFTIATFVDPVPVVTDGNISVNFGTGTGNAFKVGDQVIVSWFNNLDGNTGLTSITADLSGWGGSANTVMTDTTDCFGIAGNNVYEACHTLTAGSIDATNVNASVTACNLGGCSATGDTSNRTVDNQPPTISTTALSVTGATGTSGAFKLGNTPVGRWDNSAIGDNNTDISSVSFNMGDFKAGDTNLAGSNSSNIWTASILGAMDAQGDTNNNVTVTVTDNAGNQSTLAGTNNYTVDTIRPTINSITSVEGDTTAPYYDSTDDGLTTAVFDVSDTGTGISACRFDTSNISYSSMSGSACGLNNCVFTYSGEGLKTVYLACIDSAGNTTAANAQIDYTIDETEPSGTSIAPALTRIIDNTYPSFLVDDGTDTVSGINTSTRLLERQEANYTNNACGSFGSFTTITPSGTYPNLSDNTVSGSKCYIYRWSVSDNAGNSSSAISSTIIRVPLTTLTITGGNNQSYGSTSNPIGYTLPTALQVRVTDGGTNTALANEVTVDFAIISTPASPAATGQSLSVSSNNTNASGYAETTFTFGDRAGDYLVEASTNDGAVSSPVIFTLTAEEYTHLDAVEDSFNLDLDPFSVTPETFSPTLHLTTNAASYDLYLTPNQWPLSGTNQIGNWLSSLGFGWSWMGGMISAFLENAGEPTATLVTQCAGDACQGTQTLDVDFHFGIDFTVPAGTYTNQIQYSIENLVY